MTVMVTMMMRIAVMEQVSSTLGFRMTAVATATTDTMVVKGLPKSVNVLWDSST